MKRIQLIASKELKLTAAKAVATVLRFRPYTVPKLHILSRTLDRVQLVRLPIAS